MKHKKESDAETCKAGSRKISISKRDKNIGESKIENTKGAAANSNKASGDSEIETKRKQDRRETRPSETAK